MSLAATYRNVARAQWPTLVVTSLLFGGALGALPFLQTPTYRAETVIDVSFTPPADGHPTKPPTTQAAGEPTLPPESADRSIARQVTTFTQMANDKAITQPAIASLGLPYTPAELGAEITASTPFNSTTINIAVTDTEPQRAADIATAVSRELALAAEQAVIEAGQEQPVLKLARPATVPAAPQPVDWLFPMVAGLLAGLAVGLTVVVFRHGLRSGGAALARGHHEVSRAS